MIAEIKEEIKPTTNTRKVGIDLELNNFNYDTNNRFEHPRCSEKSLYKLTKGQRRLSKMKSNFNNRGRQRIRIARVHEKIVNQRNNFLYKLSRYHVNNYGLICSCGLVANWVYNPALNILNKALLSVQQESTPAEIESLLLTEQIRSKKQEVACMSWE